MIDGLLKYALAAITLFLASTFAFLALAAAHEALQSEPVHAALLFGASMAALVTAGFLCGAILTYIRS